MTTTGEQLVSLSGLPTGTAEEHLLAITAGGGSGETVWVDSVAVDVAGIEVDVAGIEVEVELLDTEIEVEESEIEVELEGVDGEVT